MDFNSPLLTMETSSRLRINNERVVLNNTIEQMDLTDIQDSPPDSNRTQLLLKHAQNIFQYRWYARPQNKSNKFNKTEIISSIFFNHNGMKPEISNRKLTHMKIEQLNLKQLIYQITNQKRNKTFLEVNEIETQHNKLMECNKSNSKRKVCSYKHMYE